MPRYQTPPQSELEYPLSEDIYNHITHFVGRTR
nr:MAG TPA: hypothetical protein [Caudoviricetes sp.]